MIHGVLGQTTDYPKTYNPDVLFAIDRAQARQGLAVPAERLMLGVDYWQCFEVSWLNAQGISQVAMMRLAIPADSRAIVESKSLKLYLNSFNFSTFDHAEQVQATICRDLSVCLGAQVTAEWFTLSASALPVSDVAGEVIDAALDGSETVLAICDDVDASHLVQDKRGGDAVRQCYVSHLLRSNCPVTNQPDWGTVQIDITAAPIDKQGLLAYVLSYRNHNGFHEQCVEQIFADLSVAFCPSHLMVRAWYTRRGGIDINPVRVSDADMLKNMAGSRLVRQ